jgi:hypothetical protein
MLYLFFSSQCFRVCFCSCKYFWRGRGQSNLPISTSYKLVFSPRPFSFYSSTCSWIWVVGCCSVLRPSLSAAWLCLLCRAHIVSSTRASLCAYCLLAVCCESLHITAASASGDGGRSSEGKRRSAFVIFLSLLVFTAVWRLAL